MLRSDSFLPHLQMVIYSLPRTKRSPELTKGELRQLTEGTLTPRTLFSRVPEATHCRMNYNNLIEMLVMYLQSTFHSCIDSRKGYI